MDFGNNINNGCFKGDKMKYISNIKLNLKNDLYNFYEWLEQDNIKTYNNVPIIKVSNRDYKEILLRRITVSDQLLNKIYIKEYNKYICIFSNEVDALCLEFNKKGYSIKCSKLQLETEYDVLLKVSKDKSEKIKFNTKSKYNYSFYTREENNVRNKLISKISNIKNNTDAYNYVYFEWFNKTIAENKYEDLVESIKKSDIDRIRNFNEIIKLINV